jgi:hypothetical protein
LTISTQRTIKIRDRGGLFTVHVGRRYCGFVRESDGNFFMAIDEKGISVGRFRDRRAAIGALSAQRRGWAS